MDKVLQDLGANQICRRGLLFILSSPSGAGKTTLAKRLMAHNKDMVVSVSVTTRPMRVGEKEGQDYYFVQPEQYEQMVRQGQLLEHAIVHNNGYGTPRLFVEQALQNSQDVLFDIDWQGAQQLRQALRNDVVSVFILPPSAQELYRRLTSRNTDLPEVIEHRMRQACREIEHWREYDYVLFNDDADKCLQKLQAILQTEQWRRVRWQDNLSLVVQKMIGDLSQGTW